MKVIWNLGGATAKSVHEALSPKNDINSYFSILTTLRTLRKKGILMPFKRGKSFFFEPLLTHRQAASNQIRDVVNRYFDKDPQRLVAWLSEHPFNQSGRTSSKNSIVGREQYSISTKTEDGRFSPIKADR